MMTKLTATWFALKFCSEQRSSKKWDKNNLNSFLLMDKQAELESINIPLALSDAVINSIWWARTS